MEQRRSAYRGCLLGLAVGDAMGYTVDASTWDQIRENYGPNGLLGYDLVNGYADVTSYTQLAAFACNGLLLGMTRGQLRGAMAPLVRYVALAVREWAQSQRSRISPGKTYCWTSQVRQLCARRCMDTLMLDTLTRERLGTPEEPGNRYTTPGSLTAAVPAGLFSGLDIVSADEADRLGAETVALTHGHPTSFIAGAVLAHLIAGTVRMPDQPMEQRIEAAMDRIQLLFGREYPQTLEVWELLRLAVTLAHSETIGQVEAMERLGCSTCPEVLAGAVYACLVSHGDFDAAMITAVNHSGRSAAVGAVTGALLGAQLGEEALPEFYLECLEPVDALRQLADDLIQGCPMDMGSCLFDDDWDQKYVQGKPVDRFGWEEA